MKTPSPSTRRQLYLLAGLAVLLILAVVKMGGRGSSGVPARAASSSSPASARSSPAGGVEEDRPAAPRRAPRASREKTPTAEDVPFLTKDMLNPPRPRTGEAGRNIFDPRQPTPTPAPTPTPLPPPPPGPGSALFVGPLPPPGPTPTPVPPAISFKFIGTFGPKDQPIAVLLQGDQLLNARAGDVVFGRFILRNIGYESVDIGYIGYPPAVIQKLGITP
ncbi:MAG TPA: hypothetical protein VKH43_02795 [Thermoanaerobaculia bacterium]|nr:hypothetical protein [Thermoanaerobaculia bacterium]